MDWVMNDKVVDHPHTTCKAIHINNRAFEESRDAFKIRKEKGER